MISVSNKTIRVGAISIIAVLLLRLVFFPGATTATTVVFYPEVCLGSWLEVSHAAGVPDFSEPSPEDYTQANAAVLMPEGISQVFCSDFTGEIPEYVFPKEAQVRFNWSFRYEENTPSVTLDPFESEEVLIIEVPLPTLRDEVAGLGALDQSTDSEEEILITPPDDLGTETSDAALADVSEEEVAPEEEAVQGDEEVPQPAGEPVVEEIIPEDQGETEVILEVSWQKRVQSVFTQIRRVTLIPSALAQAEAAEGDDPYTSAEPEPEPEVVIEVEAQPEPEEVSPAVDSTPSEGEVLGAIVSTEEGAEIAPESFDGADQTGEEPVDSSEEVAEGGETAGATAEEDPADLVQSTTSSENIGAEIVEVEEVVPTSTPEDESPQDTLLANEAIENEESPSEDVVEESQPDYFLELTYSIAGAEPVVFGYASLEDANGKLATLPGEVVNNWNEIKNLQIGVRPVSVLSDMPTIYLESIALEVSYLEPVKPAENKNVQGLSMRSVQKNIALNPNALHLCSIEPFVVDVSGVDSTVSTLHLIKEDGFDYQIEVGSLPLGIDVALGKEGRYVHEPKKRQDDLELLITRDYGAREGSFSIPIIFTQLTEQGAESNVICQMNVVNESS